MQPLLEAQRTRLLMSLERPSKVSVCLSLACWMFSLLLQMQPLAARGNKLLDQKLGFCVDVIDMRVWLMYAFNGMWNER